MAGGGESGDLVQQAGAGLIFPPQDPVALAEVVTRLVALSVEEREQLGRAGAQFYVLNLSMRAGVDLCEKRMQILVQPGL